MRYWDIYLLNTGQTISNVSSEEIRDKAARGELGPEDLIRRPGSARWTKLADVPNLTFGTPQAEAPIIEEAEAEIIEEAEADADEAPAPFVIDPNMEHAPPTYDGEIAEGNFAPPSMEFVDEHAVSQFEIAQDAFTGISRDDLRRAEMEAASEFEFTTEPTEEAANPLDPPKTITSAPPSLRQAFGTAAVPQLPEPEPDEDAYNKPVPDIDFEELEPVDEDEEAAGFTLARNKAETVEELDLAAMVDVAFQLVLFFLVTAQVVMFKTLEIPNPNEEKPPEAAAQSRSKSIDELEKDYILVEIDAASNIKIDRQPVTIDRKTLVELLRKAREETQRKAILINTDAAARHENVVLVLDVANEIDLRVAIAQPSSNP